MSLGRLLIAWLLAAMLCSGCFKSPAQMASPRLYLLQSPKLRLGPPGCQNTTLVIETFRANTLVRTSRMPSLTTGLISYTSNNLWAAPPADMLTDLLILHLGDSGLFKAVCPGGMIPNPDFTLTGVVEKFQTEKIAGKLSAVLQTRLILVRNPGTLGNKAFILQKKYTITRQLENDSPAAFARAMSVNTQLFIKQMARDLVNYIGKTVLEKENAR